MFAHVVGPDLGLQVEVALRDCAELRHRTGRLDFDRVPGLLEQAPGDMGGDVLSGPLVDGDSDGIRGISPCAGGRRSGEHCRCNCLSQNGS